jgi:hypothetical protein
VKRTFTASITREGDWYIARSLDLELASQGKTEEEALLNLREALELYFTPPVAGDLPDLRQLEVEIGAAKVGGSRFLKPLFVQQRRGYGMLCPYHRTGEAALRFSNAQSLIPLPYHEAKDGTLRSIPNLRCSEGLRAADIRQL